MATDPGDEDDEISETDDGDTNDVGSATDASGPIDDEVATDEDDAGGAVDDVTSTTGDVRSEEIAADPGDANGGVSSDDTTWGVLVHIAAFVGIFIPFGNVLGPLVVWLIKKDESEFVDASGKQALNFQITWTIIFLVAAATILVGIGLLLVPIVGLAWLILVVLATVKASNGEVYDYPLTIDLIS